LIGDYQEQNKTVLQTIRVPAETQFKVNEEAIELGLNQVKNTGLQQQKPHPKQYVIRRTTKKVWL
jgi:hypothetical protein